MTSATPGGNSQNRKTSCLTSQIMPNEFLIHTLYNILQGVERASLNFTLLFTLLRPGDPLLWHWLICKKLHRTDSQTMGESYRYLSLRLCTFSFKFRPEPLSTNDWSCLDPHLTARGESAKPEWLPGAEQQCKVTSASKTHRNIRAMGGHNNFTWWWKRDEKKCCYPSKALTFITL